MSEASDRAYSEIRRAIKCGKLLPGDRLVERTLCAELEMSRTPVREALSRLTAEGVVTRRPHRGMVVAEIKPEELEEIFEVGLLIESYMTRLAASKILDNSLEKLRKILDEMHQALAGSDPDTARYIDLDHQFHQLIATSAGNQRLLALWRSSMDARVLYQAFRHYTTEQLRQSAQQHEALLEALQARDAEWASTAMRHHILTGRATSRSSAGGDSDQPELAVVRGG